MFSYLANTYLSTSHSIPSHPQRRDPPVVHVIAVQDKITLAVGQAFHPTIQINTTCHCIFTFSNGSGISLSENFFTRKVLNFAADYLNLHERDTIKQINDICYEMHMLAYRTNLLYARMFFEDEFSRIPELMSDPFELDYSFKKIEERIAKVFKESAKCAQGLWLDFHIQKCKIPIFLMPSYDSKPVSLGDIEPSHSIQAIMQRLLRKMDPQHVNECFSMTKECDKKNLLDASLERKIDLLPNNVNLFLHNQIQIVSDNTIKNQWTPLQGID